MSPMSMLPRMACKVWWLPQSLAEGHRTRRWYLWRQVSFGRFSDGHQRFTACAAAGCLEWPRFFDLYQDNRTGNCLAMGPV